MSTVWVLLLFYKQLNFLNEEKEVSLYWLIPWNNNHTKFKCSHYHHGVYCRISWFWHSHAWLLLIFLKLSMFYFVSKFEVYYLIFQKQNMAMHHPCPYRLKSPVESRNLKNLRETGTCVTLPQKVTPHVLFVRLLKNTNFFLHVMNAS